MKLKIMMGYLAGALLSVSCADQMDYKEYSQYDKNYVEEYFNNVRSLVTNVYSYMDYDYGNYGGAMAASATDEAVYAIPGTSVDYFYNGSWGPAQPLDSRYTACYEAISNANIYLSDFSKGLTFPDYELNDEYKDQMTQYQKYFPYEVRFLRAFYYFELVRQYGDVPFFTEKLSTDKVNQLPRTSYKYIFTFIDNECHELQDKIPASWGESDAPQTSGEVLRVTKLGVMALRARAALYAASPLFNTNNDKSLWKKAADETKALIDACEQRGLKLGAYTEIWDVNNAKIGRDKELIMVRPTGVDKYLEDCNFPVGITGAGNGGNCPSQTLVEAYDKKDGTALDWSNPAAAVAQLGNLDPRFGMTIAKNGDKWPFYNAAGLQTYYNGVSGEPNPGGTPTGYYLKKLLDTMNQIDKRPGKNTSIQHNAVIFRLGEFYLNYAEAVYKYTGKVNTPYEGGMSAIDAVNKIRQRPGVDMPTLLSNLSGDEFWRRYEKERFVELAFEGHRFWDLRRWKEGDKFKSVKELKITKEGNKFTYRIETVNRAWDNKKYFFPIPQDEILKHKQYGVEWGQNKGW